MNKGAIASSNPATNRTAPNAPSTPSRNSIRAPPRANGSNPAKSGGMVLRFADLRPVPSIASVTIAASVASSRETMPPSLPGSPDARPMLVLSSAGALTATSNTRVR